MKKNYLKPCKIKSAILLAALCLTGFAQVQHDLLVDLDFENGIADSSSQNQTTSITGTVGYANDMWGNANACAQFSSITSGNVNLTSLTGSYKVSYPATISCWVNLNAFGTVTSPIVTTEDHATNNSGLTVEILSTGAIFASYGNNTPAGSTARKSFQTAGGAITLNAWYHIAVVYNSNTSATVYVNGIAQVTTTSGTATACVYAKTAGSEGKIGGYIKGSTNKTLDGMIDKVKIYGAALTYNEVLALYYINHQNNSTLLLNYNMNNNYGDASIYNQTSAELGTCMYESDRQAFSNGALNCADNSAIEIQNATGNFKATFPMTFAAWLKLDTLTSYNPIFTNDDNTTTYSGVWIQLTSTGNIAVNIGSGTGTSASSRRSYITTSTIAANSQWNHIALVLKPAAGATQYTADIYVNGVLQTIGAQSGTGGAITYGTTSGAWGKIGAYTKGSATTNALNGALDDVMFWNDSLSQAQIIGLFTNYYTTTTGIKKQNNELAALSVFPNPSSDIFTVSISKNTIDEIRVMDLLGNLLLRETNLVSNSTTIDLTKYTNGIYFVQLKSGNETSTQKIIKSN